MKILNIILAMVMGLMLVASCETDNDSNPILRDATEFVLNKPPYASTVYDLKHSQTVKFTCSQPNYGFPAVTNYQVQMSLTGEFNEAAGEETPATYYTFSTIFTNPSITVDAQEMAAAIVGLTGIEEEDEFYSKYKDPIKLFVRIKAYIDNGIKPIISNVIELSQVQTYFALSPMEMPVEMYIIGSFNNWDWASGYYTMIPVHSAPGKFWRMTYFDTDTEVKFNSITEWGGDFGFTDTNIPNPTFAGVEDSGGNIKVTKAGWYVVVVTTEVEGRSFNYSVEFTAPNVYLCGKTAGGTWGADPAYLFTIPTAQDGEFVSPAFIDDSQGSDDGGVRACIKLEGHEWWNTEFIVLGGKIEYRAGGNELEQIPGKIGQNLYLNFATGEGAVK